MSVGHWNRLAATLAEAGVDAKVHTLGPASWGITLRRGPHLIEIGDKYWRKNHSVWVGWQVHFEDPEGFVLWYSPTTKKRNEVRGSVLAAMEIAEDPAAPCAICREPFTAIRHRGVSARYGHPFTRPATTDPRAHPHDNPETCTSCGDGVPFHDAEALRACGLIEETK